MPGQPNQPHPDAGTKEKNNCEKLDELCSTTCCVQLIIKNAFWIVLSFSFAVYVQEMSLQSEKQLPEIKDYSKWDTSIIFVYVCVRNLVYCCKGCGFKCFILQQLFSCSCFRSCCCCSFFRSCSCCCCDSCKDVCARVAHCLWIPNFPKWESFILSSFSFGMSLFVFVKKSYEFPTDYEGLLRKDRQMYLLMTRILFLLFVMLTSFCWTPKKYNKSPPTGYAALETVPETEPSSPTSGTKHTKTPNSESFGTVV